MKVTKQQLKQLIQEELELLNERERPASLGPEWVEDPDQPGAYYDTTSAVDSRSSSQPAGGADLKNEVVALEKALNQIKAKLGMA